MQKNPRLGVQALYPPDTQAWASCGVALPSIGPQFPHLKAGGGQDLAVSGTCGVWAWAGRFGRRPRFPTRW